MDAQQSPLQEKVLGLIQKGHIVPATKDAKDHTRFVATINGREVTLYCDENGQLYFPKTGKHFVLKK
jgi:hypothetical protein